MSFCEEIKKTDIDIITRTIYEASTSDVEAALQKSKRNINDFAALISPAAEPFLEQMAFASNKITQKRFGKTIQLYIPLYLSNFCSNSCSYCGFNSTNKIDRLKLSDEEILQEVRIIKEMGFDHVLLVTGESDSKAGFEYIKNAVSLVKPFFASVSAEVQPLSSEEYSELKFLGLHSVYIYQETYNKTEYCNYHKFGKKSDFNWRLTTPERLGNAGIFKIGLGVLLGLEDWRTDSYYLALHLQYLEKKFWKTKYSISFPRLRPAAGIIEPKVAITDRELVQLICAYRLLNEEVELSISTREKPSFRNNIIKLGVTAISAGAKTNPGGYNNSSGSLEQFSVADNRHPQEVANEITAAGYEPVWKDWDKSFS